MAFEPGNFARRDDRPDAGSGGRGGRRREIEWMIFEVSEDHIRIGTLPAMVAQFVNSGDDPIYDLSVSWRDAARSVIFRPVPANPASFLERI